MDVVIDLPLLQILLLAIMFLALLVEIKTGGMGAGIMLWLVAAGVFWGSQYVKGLVDLTQIAIFLGGILCIVIEMLLPTVGLLAGLGIAALLYSVVLSLGGDINAVYAMLIALVVAILLFALIVKRLPNSRCWNKLVLKDNSTTEKGFVSATPRDYLIGKTGLVLTELRPAGTALIDTKSVDVVSNGAFIAKGEMIKVVTVEGNRVVVSKLKD